MKNIKILFFLFFTLTLNLSSIQAQAWYVYDGSIVPDALSEWTISFYNPGQDFVEDIITDSHISGNKFLRYLQANEIGADFIGNARKYYRHDFVDANPEITIIARQKCIAIDSLSGELGFVMEISDGPRSIRDALLVSPDDSTLKLQRAGNSIKVNANLFEWHLYRMTFNAIDSTSTIYFDENITAVLTGKTTSNTSSNYFRFGDGGSPRVAGYTDWIIIDTTGAYNPADGAAIPDSCSTATGPQINNKPGTGYDLIYVTKTTNKHADGYYADSMNVANLATAGFNVTIPDYATINTTPFFTAIDAADIVVIGRDVSSGDFGSIELVSYWEKLQKPIILMNSYLARDSRLKWLPTQKLYDYSRFGELSAKIKVPLDSAFKNITVPADSIIHYSTDNITFLNIFDSVRANVNGEALSTFANGGIAYAINNGNGDTTATIDMSQFDGMPLMIRWEPLSDSMYSGISNGSSSVRPLGWRTFIPGGGDADWDYNLSTRKYAYDVFSDAMKSVIVNEAVYLLTLPVPDISDDNTLDTLKTSVGTMDPAFAPTVFSYTIDVPEGTTSITLTAVTNNSKSTIDNGGVFVIPFNGSDTPLNFNVTSEAGSVQAYSVIMKKEIIVSGKIIPAGTGNISAYLSNAVDGDTFFLINGATYNEFDAIVIDKEITLRAQNDVELPALDPTKMPLINNEFAVANIFNLVDGADFRLIGIDVDGGGSAYKIFNATGSRAVINGVYVNRCRLHNCTGDILGVRRSDTIVLKKATFINSFVYDAGAHGIYIKDFYVEEGINGGPYLIKDITFWNLRQQFIWIQMQTKIADDATTKSTYVLDHLTGWNLSTGLDKELFGNSDGGGLLDVTLKNSILSEQATPTIQPSLFCSTYNNRTSGQDNVVTLRNLVMFNVEPETVRPGSDPIVIDNKLTADPSFADAANGDFTVGNTAYHAAADGGEVIGARYWHPNFVDDFSDLTTSTENNSFLDSIFVNGEIIDGFNKGIFNYVYTIEAGASIPTTAFAVISGNPVVVIKNASNLNGTKEERTTTLTVTSENELYQSTYSIEFHTLSSDASLSDLKVDGTTINGFKSNSLVYSYNLPSGTVTIPTVVGITSNDSASVNIVPATNLNGTTAERTTQITVTAENKITKSIYSIVFYTLSSNAKLSDLKVDGTTINGFESNSLVYSYNLPSGTVAIPKVEGITSNDSASINIVPATNLNGTTSERTTQIYITAQDTNYKANYSVMFTVKTSSINENYKNRNFIYPTIVKDELFINHFEAITQVEIISISGKTILVDIEHMNAEKLDVSFLQAGVYIIKLRSESGIYMDRFIKE